MGRDIQDIRDNASRIEEEEETRPWPKIDEYKEGDLTINVYRPGYAEGVCIDHRVKPPKKGNS